jgi:proteasome lid subunit RPN8/RPN11
MKTINDRILDDIVRDLRGATTPVRSEPTLEERILAAHKSGDHELLSALQEQFRSEVGAGLRDVERLGPAPILIEGGRRSQPSGSSGGTTRTRTIYAPGIIGIKPGALRSIDAFWRGDSGLETTGYLFGYITETCFLIEHACEAGEGSRRTPTSVEWDSEEAERYEEVFRLPCVGDWHTHPGVPDPKPSGQDRSFWGLRAGSTGHPWASIILGDNGSPYWPKRGFVTTFNGGRTRTYPAMIEEEF